MSRIADNILSILGDCRVEGDTLFLPDRQLDRPTYQAVNKVLVNIGGKWNHKAQGHVFADGDPAELLNNVLMTGETVDLKKQYQFFPTPRPVAEWMCRMAELDSTCVVLERRKEGTLLMAVEHIEHTFGSSNNFAASSLRAHLNGAYLEALTENHPDEIITRTVDLTALNGSKEYGTVGCKVAPLTLDELRKYHGIIPKPEVWEWSATPWSTPKVDDDDTWVLGLNSSGNLYYSSCSLTYGSRPAFTLPSTLTIEVEDEEPVNPLEQYSVNELVAEVNRRMNA